MRKLLALLLLACAVSAANITVDAPVKNVTLYSNGFAFITRSGTANVPDGAHTLHIANFTDSAIPASITPVHSNARVTEFYGYSMEWNESKNITEYYSIEKLLNSSVNKNISFASGNESAGGTLVWFNEGLIGVSANGGVSIYRVADLKRITLPAVQFSGTRQENESREEHGLAVGVKDGSGSGTLSISYLAAGADWGASYKYYIATEAVNGSGTLQGWARVENNAGEDWDGVSLRLVVGNPHMQPIYTPFRYPYNLYTEKAADAARGAPSIAPEFTPSQVSAYYVYTLAGTATIRQGEARSLPLLNKAIPYKREYFWDTSNTHPEKVFILNNTGNESWASGVVSIYLDGEFLGESVIDYTPKSTGARVSVSDLPDIATKKETLNQTSTATARSRTTYYKVRLTLKNAMGEDVVVRINDKMVSGDEVKLVSSTIPAQVKPGNVIEWNASIAKGGSQEIVYEYTVTNYYTEPHY